MSNQSDDDRDDDRRYHDGASWKDRHGGTIMGVGMLTILVLLAVFHSAC